jgi:hypothetical protein
MLERNNNSSRKLSQKLLTAQDIVGASVAMKRRKMTEKQRIYAESLITDVLKQGLLQNVTAYTRLKEPFANELHAFETSSNSSSFASSAQGGPADHAIQMLILITKTFLMIILPQNNYFCSHRYFCMIAKYISNDYNSKEYLFVTKIFVR